MSRRQSAGSSDASLSRSCARADRWETGRSSPARFISPPTASGSSFWPPLAPIPASGSTSRSAWHPRGGHFAPGLARGLNAAERLTLADAVAGLYKMSGVKLVHPPGEPVCPSWAEPGPAGEATMSPGSVDFTAVVIPWRAWVEAWEGEALRGPEAGGAARRMGVLRGLAPKPERSDLG